MSERDNDTGKPAIAAESAACGPIVGKGYIIGHIDNINGEGAQLVNWTPTRAELRVLGLHYLERYYSVQQTYAMGTSGSWEWRESTFSWQRFISIANALGEETIIPEWDAYIEEQEKSLLETEAEMKELEARSRHDHDGEAQ